MYQFKMTVVDNETGWIEEFEYKNYPTALAAYNVAVRTLYTFSAHKYTVRLVDTTFDFVLNEESGEGIN